MKLTITQIKKLIEHAEKVTGQLIQAKAQLENEIINYYSDSCELNKSGGKNEA